MKSCTSLFLTLVLVMMFSSLALAGTPCGLRGSIDERIANCQSVFGEKAMRQLTIKPDPVEPEIAVWKLVGRAVEGDNLWREEQTKLLWTDQLSMKVYRSDADRLCNQETELRDLKLGIAGFHVPSRKEFQRALDRGLMQMMRFPPHPEDPYYYWMAWASDYHPDDYRYSYLLHFDRENWEFTFRAVENWWLNTIICVANSQ